MKYEKVIIHRYKTAKPDFKAINEKLSKEGIGLQFAFGNRRIDLKPTYTGPAWAREISSAWLKSKVFEKDVVNVYCITLRDFRKLGGNANIAGRNYGGNFLVIVDTHNEVHFSLPGEKEAWLKSGLAKEAWTFLHEYGHDFPGHTANSYHQELGRGNLFWMYKNQYPISIKERLLSIAESLPEPLKGRLIQLINSKQWT